MNTKNQSSDLSSIHYPLADALPEVGSSMEVAPGVRWLRMRLPFALDHINLWLLRDEFEGVAGADPRRFGSYPQIEPVLLTNPLAHKTE